MNNACKVITFTAVSGENFSGVYEDNVVVKGALSNGEIVLSILYDFDPKPLSVRGVAKVGDMVRLVILPYRLELYINEQLLDEEWPCGANYLDRCTLTDCGCNLQMQEEPYVSMAQPTVLGEFENAEGWCPGGGVSVGDCIPFSHDGVYHVLYLKDRHHGASKWGRGAHQWAHISTRDLVHWQQHPMALEIDDPREGSLCTGSWFLHNGTHYLYYTVRMYDWSPAPICRARSMDGYHFEKDREFSFFLSEKYNQVTARDPKVIAGEDGLFHMILTSNLAYNQQGCLVHLVSADMETWEELPEPIYIAPMDKGAPECPDYFYKDGYYYLIFSLHEQAQYLISEKPFTDWRVPENPYIPCRSVPKMALWNDRILFAGFDGHGVYAGTLHLLEAKQQPNGEMTYQAVE